MRHGKGIKKLGRTGPHRRATLRNMAAALIEHERIETTDTKAKALRSFVEKLVTLGKRGDLHARRMASVHVRDRDLLKKLFDDLGPRFAERPGGYTRVLKLGHRKGDNGLMSLIEFVDSAPDTAGADTEATAEG